MCTQRVNNKYNLIIISKINRIVIHRGRAGNIINNQIVVGNSLINNMIIIKIQVIIFECPRKEKIIPQLWLNNIKIWGRIINNRWQRKILQVNFHIKTFPTN